MFAEHDGYDSSGNSRVDNPRVDVDITILPDVIMEDATNRAELNSKNVTETAKHVTEPNPTTLGYRHDEVVLL